MNGKYGVPRGVRLTQENCERLEHAKKLGFSASRVINEMLERHLGEYLGNKVKELHKVLGAPVR